MDIAQEIKEFLMSRRARISPEDAGLMTIGHRRVPGLRREEVAMLAGMSPDYYVQIERGRVAGVSDEVIGAIARALQLDDTERRHLNHLIRAATKRTSAPPPSRAVPEAVQRLMDSMAMAPAVILSGKTDIVAHNTLGRALYSEIFDRVAGTPNFAKFMFADPKAREVFPDWDDATGLVVSLIRMETARRPQSREMAELVAELSDRSDEFTTLWEGYDLMSHITGVKRVRHPVAGLLELDFSLFDVRAAHGLKMVGFTAAAGSETARRLETLSEWAHSETAREPA